jgi:hypothetical protein
MLAWWACAVNTNARSVFSLISAHWEIAHFIYVRVLVWSWALMRAWALFCGPLISAPRKRDDETHKRDNQEKLSGWYRGDGRNAMPQFNTPLFLLIICMSISHILLCLSHHTTHTHTHNTTSIISHAGRIFISQGRNRRWKAASKQASTCCRLLEQYQ